MEKKETMSYLLILHGCWWLSCGAMMTLYITLHKAVVWNWSTLFAIIFFDTYVIKVWLTTLDMLPPSRRGFIPSCPRLLFPTIDWIFFLTSLAKGWPTCSVCISLRSIKTEALQIKRKGMFFAMEEVRIEINKKVLQCHPSV